MLVYLKNSKRLYRLIGKDQTDEPCCSEPETNPPSTALKWIQLLELTANTLLHVYWSPWQQTGVNRQKLWRVLELKTSFRCWVFICSKGEFSFRLQRLYKMWSFGDTTDERLRSEGMLGRNNGFIMNTLKSQEWKNVHGFFFFFLLVLSDSVRF